MVVTETKTFTPAQCEIINMMSCVTDGDDLTALKSVLVQFLNARLQRQIDGLYADGTLSDSKVEEFSRRHLRTPYSAR